MCTSSCVDEVFEYEMLVALQFFARLDAQAAQLASVWCWGTKIALMKGPICYISSTLEGAEKASKLSTKHGQAPLLDMYC